MKQKERKWECPPGLGNESILFYLDLIRDYCNRIEEMISENRTVDISEYKIGLHPIQEKLIRLNEDGLLKGKGYRKIGKMVGVGHPQQIKHHLTQLKKHNLL